MARNDQQDSYEKLLSASHGRMLDLVKFAETKNAALLTFCSGWDRLSLYSNPRTNRPWATEQHSLLFFLYWP